MRRWIMASAALAAVCVASASVGEPVRDGIVIYDVPIHWVRGEAHGEGDQRVTSLKPGPVSRWGDEYRGGIMILPRQAFKGTLRQAMDKQIAAMVKPPARIVERGETRELKPQRGEAFTILLATAVVDHGDMTTHQIYAANNAGGKMHFFAFMGNKDGADVWEDDFEDFVRSVTYTPLQKPVPRATPGTPVPGLPKGVYYRCETGLRMTISGMTEFQADHLVRVFLGDGRVYTEQPAAEALPAGVDTLAWNELKAREPTSCATYAIGDGTITIGSADAVGRTEVETGALELHADGVSIDGDRWWRIEPARDLRLEGAFRHFNLVNMSNMSQTQSGGAYREEVYVFRKDGTFSRDGSSGVSLSTSTEPNQSGHRVHVGSTRPQGPSAGTYAFNDFVLTTTVDGKVERVSALLVESGLLLIDGRPFVRKDDDEAGGDRSGAVPADRGSRGSGRSPN